MSDPETSPVDLPALCGAAAGSGPLWSRETDDLDMTLLLWERGKAIAAHVNSEVDVFVVVIEGEGDVTVDSVVHRLRAGHSLLIPRGAVCGFVATAASFGYLSIHKRRGGLQITRRPGSRP